MMNKNSKNSVFGFSVIRERNPFGYLAGFESFKPETSRA